MTGLILSILTGLVSYTGMNITGYIQEQYVIESYFNCVDEQEPIVYRRGRILGQQFQKYMNGSYITGRQYTNRSDCGGMIVGYMIELDLIKTRWKDIENKSFTFDGGGLNSYRLYKLGKPKKASEVKRGDFVYMEFSGGNRHIAVACEDGNPYNIYDLYESSDAKCRIVKAPLMKYSSNGIVEFARWKGIVLSGTQEILDIYNNINAIPYNQKDYYYTYMRYYIEYHFGLILETEIRDDGL